MNDVDVRIYLVSNVGTAEAVDTAYFRCARGDEKNVQSLGFSQTAVRTIAVPNRFSTRVFLYPGTHGQTLGCLCALLFFVHTRCTCTPASSIVAHKMRRELTVQDCAVKYSCTNPGNGVREDPHICTKYSACLHLLTMSHLMLVFGGRFKPFPECVVAGQESAPPKSRVNHHV